MTRSGSPVDRSRPVRPGEELDLDRLRAYLERELGGGGELEIEQFPSGHSNLTYLLRFGEKEYVLRRPPFGSRVKSAHDMGREHRVLSALAPHYGKAPRPVLYCEDESILGARFYLMERLTGVILRRDPPPGVDLSEPVCRRLSEVFIDTLAELHAVDYEKAGLGDLGRPDGYVERQVRGWTDRYRKSQTDEIADVDAIASWLAEHMPPSGPPSLIHNDFKLDNLVLDPDDLTRVIGILDWEMSTVGDPLMDLGTALCYWVEGTDPEPLKKLRFCPTTLPGMMSRRQLADLYAKKSGRDLGDILFYYCFGLFKTAVVVQQIYYRYEKGHTQDPRFAGFIDAVRLLSHQAIRALERERL